MVLNNCHRSPMSLLDYIRQCTNPDKIINTINNPIHKFCSEAFTINYKFEKAPSFESVKNYAGNYYMNYGEGTFEILETSIRGKTMLLDSLGSSSKIFGFKDIEARTVLFRDARYLNEGIIKLQGIEILRIKPPEIDIGLFYP